MSLGRVFLEAIGRLGVREVPDTWVSQVWDNSFCGIAGTWPLEDLNSSTITAALRAMRPELLAHAQGSAAESSADEGEMSFWISLTEESITVRNLVAVLAFHMASIEERPETAALAADVYTILMQITGSSAHSVRNALLLRTLANILKNWPSKEQAAGSSAAGSKKSGSKRKADSDHDGMSSKKRAAADSDAEEDEVMAVDDEEEDSSEFEATQARATAPIEVMNLLLCDVVRMLKTQSFKNNMDVYDMMAETLSLIVRLNAEGVTVKHMDEIAGTQVKETAPSALLAALGLFSLCSPVHRTPEDENVRSAFKNVLQNITMKFHTVQAFIPKAIRHVKDISVALVCAIIAEFPHTHATSRLLIQHICTSVPDRAEYRAQTAASVSAILAKLPSTVFTGIVDWVVKLSRHQRVAFRTFAVDVIHVLLENNQARESDAGEEEEEGSGGAGPRAARELRMQARLLNVIVSRASDKAPTVRSKAISNFATLLDLCIRSDSRPDLRGAISELLLPSAHEAAMAVDSALQEASGETPGKKTAPGTPGTPTTPATANISMHDEDGLLATIRRRIADPKSVVRRFALRALASTMTLPAYKSDQKDIDLLYNRCLDPVLTVRKEALDALTMLLPRFSGKASFLKKWLNSALPMVMDREDAARQQAADALQSVLLTGIMSADAAAQNLAWDLLIILDAEADMRRYVQRACAMWERKGCLTKSVTKALMDRLFAKQLKGGWTLLGEIAIRQPREMDAEAILKAWENRNLDDLVTSSFLLGIIAAIAPELSSGPAKKVSAMLKRMISEFCLPAHLIAPALIAVCKLEKDSEFASSVLGDCVARLSAIVFSEDSPETVDEVSVGRYLFTLGEAAMMCPESLDDRIVLVVQGIVSAKDKGLDAAGDKNESTASSGESPFSASIRAHAFLALGKLCLLREELAKQWASSMARELDVCTDPAVRNNIVVILSDLCIRYTAVVERFVPNLAGCLRDPSPLVRLQTLTLLTRLLSEDYIKLKGSLFFRLIVTLVDQDESVRNLSNFCLMNLLSSKNAAMFYTHFVECVFHFNDYREHPTFNRFIRTEKESDFFPLRGVDGRSKREFLYRTMLENCSDMEKLQITQSLCQDILAAVIDGTLPIGDATNGVISDALTILASKDIKLRSNKSPSAVAEEDGDEVPEAASKAKAALISKIVKKNLVENIIPIIIGLKNALEKKQSPLQRNLMAYLREVMRDFKEEVNDLMSADKQLANEIMFDLRKFEEEAKGRRDSVMSLAGNPGFLSPQLRSATPASASPLMPVNLLLTPGTPTFSPPRLRTGSTPARTHKPSRLSIATTVGSATSTSKAVTLRTPLPLRSSIEEEGEEEEEGDKVTPEKPNSLAWVRTPVSRVAGSPAIDDIICMESPAFAEKKKKKEMWNVGAPKFDSAASEKRSSNEDESDPLLDENSTDNVAPAPTKQLRSSVTRRAAGTAK